MWLNSVTKTTMETEDVYDIEDLTSDNKERAELLASPLIFVSNPILLTHISSTRNHTAAMLSHKFDLISEARRHEEETGYHSPWSRALARQEGENIDHRPIHP